MLVFCVMHTMFPWNLQVGWTLFHMWIYTNINRASVLLTEIYIGCLCCFHALKITDLRNLVLKMTAQMPVARLCLFLFRDQAVIWVWGSDTGRDVNDTSCLPRAAVGCDRTVLPAVEARTGTCSVAIKAQIKKIFFSPKHIFICICWFKLIQTADSKKIDFYLKTLFFFYGLHIITVAFEGLFKMQHQKQLSAALEEK